MHCIKQIHNTNYHCRKHIPLVPPPLPDTHTQLLTHPTDTHHYHHQPDTLTSVDPYTLLKLNQTATPQENHTEWLKLVEMAAWSCPGEESDQCKQKESPFLLVLCASDLNWYPWGKLLNSTCSGSFQIDFTLCKTCWSQDKVKALTWWRSKHIKG